MIMEVKSGEGTVVVAGVSRQVQALGNKTA